MQGQTRMVRELLDAQAVVGELVPEGSVFAVLAEHRQRLFPDSFIADLFTSSMGRPSLPADLVGSVLVLKELHDLSDPQTAEALKYDIRWKVACGRSLTQTSFDPSTLVYWRRRIAASERPDRVFDAVAEVIGRVCTLDYSKPGKPAIDWDDVEAKQGLVSDLVNDALAVLAELTGDEAPEQEAKAADALGLLALVAGQDVEPADGSDGTDGRWRIARKVAPDRVISTVDVQARHTRKSKSNRKDGYRGHVAAEPDTGLITDCEMTKAAGEDGSDPVIGEQMISRDRYHRADTAAPPHSQPADDEPADQQPAGHERADQQPADQENADQENADQENAVAESVADSVAAATDEDSDTTTERADQQPADQAEGKGLEVYGDSAYGTGQARAAYQEGGHDTVIKPKPLRPAVEGGFTLDEFTIDEHAGTVTCPVGHTRSMSPKRAVTFGKVCADCPLRERCTTAVDGRSMTIHPHEDLLRAARAQARTPEFKQAYPTRSNVERIIAFTATQSGRRVKLRYHGVTKNHAWLRTRCAAVNLRTLLKHGLTSRDGAWVLA